MRQHNEYSTISQTVLDVFYSKIGPLDEYIIMRTGEDEYGMLLHRIPSGDIIEYTIERINSSSWGNSYFVLSESSGTWDYNVTNEMYVYSNIGYGTMDILPVHEIMTSWSTVGLVCLIFLGVIFKGALFKICRK